MSGFSTEWLALREPDDHAARSVRLSRLASEALPARQCVRALDLASGTGSNVRFLTDYCGAEQSWLLADHDTGLLTAAVARLSAWGLARGYSRRASEEGVVLTAPGLRYDLQTRRADLAALDPAIFAERHLVSAAALLDLVSETWVEELAQCCLRVGAVGLFALTYDGRMACAPVLPEDDAVRDLVNQHQRSDKGFGVALGPDGAGRSAAVFAAAGFTVTRERSDWVLMPDAAALQRALIEGWAGAAAEIDPDRRPFVEGWREERLACVDAGHSSIVVGHEDLVAIPPR